MSVFKKAVITALFLLLVASQGLAYNDDIGSTYIVINLPSRTLGLYSGNNKLIKEYPVAIGKPSTSTPLGTYAITNMEVDPVWISPKLNYVVESGPDNPLGYRWMGFLPLYGIHGTNAPWAIGLAVSNGCVRMKEEDAEELFEMVTYGTPVCIVYDRVRVRMDSSGGVTLGVYPDIYGYRQATVAEAYEKLVEYGVGGFISEDVLLGFINRVNEKQEVIARVCTLKVNDKSLNECAILVSDGLYIPVWAVASALKTNIEWDDAHKLIRKGEIHVPGIVKGNIVYLLFDNLQTLFGGQQVYNQDDNSVSINTVSVLLNDKLITQDVRFISGMPAVPVQILAQALGKKIHLDYQMGTVKYNSKCVEVTVVANQPYLLLNKIHHLFDTFVYWNQPACRIELTYPSPL